MGSLYLWGPSIQEMGGNVVIGRSIYGVVVIDGSLYSQFYGICSFLYRWFDYTLFGTPYWFHKDNSRQDSPEAGTSMTVL